MASRSTEKAASTRNSPLGMSQRGDRKRGTAGDAAARRQGGRGADAREIAAAKAVGRTADPKAKTRGGQVRDQNQITASGLGERSDRSRADVRVSGTPRPGAKRRSFESRAGRTPSKNAVSTPARRGR